MWCGYWLEGKTESGKPNVFNKILSAGGDTTPKEWGWMSLDCSPCSDHRSRRETIVEGWGSII